MFIVNEINKKNIVLLIYATLLHFHILVLTLDNAKKNSSHNCMGQDPFKQTPPLSELIHSSLRTLYFQKTTSKF